MGLRRPTSLDPTFKWYYVYSSIIYVLIGYSYLYKSLFLKQKETASLKNVIHYTLDETTLEPPESKPL